MFAKIEKYGVKRKFEIFMTYASYQLLDDMTYEIMERDFIQNLNSFTSD